jgi:hypothetical protein
MGKLDYKHTEIPSPIEQLKIGKEYDYSGQYVNGYEEGTSNIKWFYKEEWIWNDIVEDDNKLLVWMELENGKLFILGHLNKKNEFTIHYSIKDKYEKI